jgi:hypothetical protein
MGGVKKFVKKALNVATLGLVGDDSQLRAQREAADRERQIFEQQQRQLQEANALSASKVTEGVAKVETGAGSDVGADIGIDGSTPKKKKATASATLGVM